MYVNFNTVLKDWYEVRVEKYIYFSKFAYSPGYIFRLKGTSALRDIATMWLKRIDGTVEKLYKNKTVFCVCISLFLLGRWRKP